MAFHDATQRVRVTLPTQTRPTGGGVTSLELPKSGLLARIYLRISATVAGTLSSPNALGVSSIIKRVRLSTNSAIDLFNVSGAGFHYLLGEAMESEYHHIQGQNQGSTAVTATTFNLDMVIPIAVNMRDPVGLFLLQNEQTQVTLEIDWEADATVATGATVTATAIPYMEYFTVPVDRADMPNLRVIHQILEDQTSISATGEYTYNLPRGNVYIGIYHGLGIGASGSDGFDNVKRRVNQSTFLDNVAPAFLDQEHYALRGRARPAGTWLVDLMGGSGLGNYGTPRDFFNSAAVTDLAHVINVTGTGTLYTVRRQLVSVQ